MNFDNEMANIKKIVVLHISNFNWTNFQLEKTILVEQFFEIILLNQKYYLVDLFRIQQIIFWFENFFLRTKYKFCVFEAFVVSQNLAAKDK